MSTTAKTIWTGEEFATLPGTTGPGGKGFDKRRGELLWCGGGLSCTCHMLFLLKIEDTLYMF